MLLTKARLRLAAFFLGLALVVAALLLLLHNKGQDKRAAGCSQRALAGLCAVSSDGQTAGAFSEPPAKEGGLDSGLTAEPPGRICGGLPVKQEAGAGSATAMPVIELDGYAYIGYLSIPTIDLELPVLADCDRQGLKIAPCRQFGSIDTDDLTIAGHNYDSHFGKLKLLQAGDRVIFTDVEGRAECFVVCAKEVLAATAVEKVRNNGWALTLYTCTYGGHQRLLVGCRSGSAAPLAQ
ncbi:MAG: sortase [Clostridiaceae bacterium]|nr:sortase [Clostridiaceae bacterium]